LASWTTGHTNVNHDVTCYEENGAFVSLNKLLQRIYTQN